MGINDAPHAVAGLNNSADVNAAFAAEQKIGCIESELVALQIAWIYGTEPEFTLRVGSAQRIVSKAKRTLTSAYRPVSGRDLCRIIEANCATMATA